MHQFEDITRLTRVAIGALWVYMIVNLLAEFGGFYTDVLSAQGRSPDELASTDILVLASLVLLLVTGIIVLRWMYRASANAHATADDLTITPGWAVGWYFVPIANLWKPFQAMKETWLASHFGLHWEGRDASDYLNWWWGLWILSSLLGNASWRLGDSAPQLGAELGLADGIITVPLTLILIRIMKQVRDAQDATRHAEVFA